MNVIHSAGIPWYATIPLTAVLARSTFVYYFSTLPGRLAAVEKSQLTPLAAAKVGVLSLEHQSKFERNFRDEPAKLALVRRLNLLVLRVQTMRYLSKQFGSRRFNLGGLFNFGVLIAFVEAVRLKCGRREGLLTLILSPFEWAGRQVFPAQFRAKPVIEPTDPADALVQRLEAVRDPNLAMDNGEMQDTASLKLETSLAEGWQEAPGQQAMESATATMTPLDAMSTSSSYFDPSLQTEGLSWCMDLTVPDPTLALPSLLALTMLATSFLRPRPFQSSSDTRASRESKQTSYSLFPAFLGSWARNLNFPQRLGICIVPLFCYASTQMPVAILLYLIPSIATGWFHNRRLEIKYPIYPPIQPCKRPSRMKVRREGT